MSSSGRYGTRSSRGAPPKTIPPHAAAAGGAAAAAPPPPPPVGIKREKASLKVKLTIGGRAQATVLTQSGTRFSRPVSPHPPPANAHYHPPTFTPLPPSQPLEYATPPLPSASSKSTPKKSTRKSKAVTKSARVKKTTPKARTKKSKPKTTVKKTTSKSKPKTKTKVTDETYQYGDDDDDDEGPLLEGEDDGEYGMPATPRPRASRVTSKSTATKRSTKKSKGTTKKTPPAVDYLKPPKRTSTRVKRKASQTPKKSDTEKAFDDEVDRELEAAGHFYSRDGIIFWKNVQEIFRPFAEEEMAEWATVRDSASLMQIPPLGPHYQEKWYQEDQRALREFNSGGGAGGMEGLDKSQDFRGSSNEEDDEIVRCSDLTARLMAALVPDVTVAASFFKARTDTTLDAYADGNNNDTAIGSVPSTQEQSRKLAGINTFLVREIKQLGLGTGEVRKKAPSAAVNDTVLQQLKVKLELLKRQHQVNTELERAFQHEFQEGVKLQLKRQRELTRITAIDEEYLPKFRAYKKRKLAEEKKKEKEAKALEEQKAAVSKMSSKLSGVVADPVGVTASIDNLLATSQFVADVHTPGTPLPNSSLLPSPIFPPSEGAAGGGGAAAAGGGNATLAMAGSVGPPPASLTEAMDIDTHS